MNLEFEEPKTSSISSFQNKDLRIEVAMNIREHLLYTQNSFKDIFFLNWGHEIQAWQRILADEISNRNPFYYTLCLQDFYIDITEWDLCLCPDMWQLKLPLFTSRALVCHLISILDIIHCLLSHLQSAVVM